MVPVGVALNTVVLWVTSMLEAQSENALTATN
jgi:hypothetical protein